jgi:ferredoxin--NADP+ reductase
LNIASYVVMNNKRRPKRTVQFLAGLELISEADRAAVARRTGRRAARSRRHSGSGRAGSMTFRFGARPGHGRACAGGGRALTLCVSAVPPIRAWDPSMSAFNAETVLSVHHWTDRLFSFKTTRHAGFRFLNGQFIMIGLEVAGRPLVRAYSIVSANYEDHLEFLSIKVPDGPLTSRLQHIKPGDQVLVGKKPTGTLVLDNLVDGRNLYLLATGTGLAPFMSIIRDPETYGRYDKVVLMHGTRLVSELAYHDYLLNDLPHDEFLGELVIEKLHYYPTVTREPFQTTGRIPALINSGKVFDDLDLPPLDPAEDRVMICGSPAMLADLKGLCEAKGFGEGNTGEPGEFVIEKAFVDK